MAGGRTTVHRPGRAGSRDGSRAAGDRRPRSLPPPAGALSGVPSRVTRRTTARARRAGGGERSRARRRPPRLAPRTGRRRTRRSRGRRPRALRRTSAEPRRPRGRSGAPRAGDGADPGPDAPGSGARWPRRRRASRPARSTRRCGSWPRRRPARSTASSAREPRLLRGHARRRLRVRQRGAAVAAEGCETARAVRPQLARRAYLTAWSAAVRANHLGGRTLCSRSAAPSARSHLPPEPASTRPADRRVRPADHRRARRGHSRSSSARRGRSLQLPVEDVLRWGWVAMAASTAMWDDDGALAVYERQAQLVRDAGALAELPIHLSALALERAWAGDLPGAALERRRGRERRRGDGSRVPPFALLRLLALQGREAEASADRRESSEQAQHEGRDAVMVAHWAAAVLYNGLAATRRRHRRPARATRNGDRSAGSMWALPELVEAAARVGDTELARDALERARGDHAACRQRLRARHRGALSGAAERRRRGRGPRIAKRSSG